MVLKITGGPVVLSGISGSRTGGHVIEQENACVYEKSRPHDTNYQKLVVGVDGSLGVVMTPKEPRNRSFRPEVVQEGLVHPDLSRLKSSLNSS
ncbi:hypothetical protein CRG98_015144 [Punica granatum]|uniref:Uncharacterized protein n=1 Tax=Punica granatum TaxID=22663 RepID=A0A2I0K8F2_PUNGR|nr:hypothetical protein CRG98_015144 [Punica granatum]